MTGVNKSLVQTEKTINSQRKQLQHLRATIASTESNIRLMNTKMSCLYEEPRRMNRAPAPPPMAPPPPPVRRMSRAPAPPPMAPPPPPRRMNRAPMPVPPPRQGVAFELNQRTQLQTPKTRRWW